MSKWVKYIYGIQRVAFLLQAWLISGSYFASVVMYDKARVPAVEMFMRSHSGLQFLQQSAVRTLSFGMHSGTHIIQHAHYTRRVLQGEDNQ